MPFWWVALNWLQSNATSFGQPGLALFFWGSGTLPSVLGNARSWMTCYWARAEVRSANQR